MAYEIKQNCERVVLNVLAGADKSIIGLGILNCKVISMTMQELQDLVVLTRGQVELNYFHTTLFSHQIHACNNEEIIVLEYVETTESDELLAYCILDLLKLYKAEDIYSCYSLDYRYRDGKLTHSSLAKIIRYEHAIDHLPARYTLADDEKANFSPWLNKYYTKLKSTDLNDSYKSMLKAYQTAFLVGIVELEYIMLFSILEMIFGSGHSEITYQISRGAALLLSDSSSEMEVVYKQMKKLYGVRSKYVHGGEKVHWDSLFELRDVVRKVLLKLIDLNYHAKGASFDDLRNKIMLSGFNAFSTDQSEGETNV